MGEYCKSVKCPWYKDNVCKSPNDHAKKADGTIECDFDRAVLPYPAQVDKAVHNAYEHGYGNAMISVQKPKASKPICKIIFDVPYYFCGDCKTMLNMYSTKAKFCSQCGQVVQWG